MVEAYKVLWKCGLKASGSNCCPVTHLLGNAGQTTFSLSASLCPLWGPLAASQGPRESEMKQL